jgi:CDP-paratose 2-epimerase
MQTSRRGGARIYVAGGGVANAMSLAQLNAWCDSRFIPHAPQPDPRPRPYDIPWMIMDSSDAERDFAWHIAMPLQDLLEGIACHAERHPDWLERSGL